MARLKIFRLALPRLLLLAATFVSLSPALAGSQASDATTTKQQTDPSHESKRTKSSKKQPSQSISATGESKSANSSGKQGSPGTSDCDNAHPCSSVEPSLTIGVDSALPIKDPNPTPKPPCKSKDEPRDMQIPVTDPCVPPTSETECKADPKALIPGVDPCKPLKKKKHETEGQVEPGVVVND